MRWFWLAMACMGFAVADQPAPSPSKHPIENVEDKLKRLEEDAGINPAPEKATGILFGDFLWWKPSLDGVAWATTAEVVPQVGGGTTYDHYKTRTAHFEYAPGFRVGGGAGLPYDHWDVLATWLRLHTSGDDHAQADGRVIFEENGLLVEMTGLPSKASAHCRVNMDVADAVVGRTFLWSRYFVFRPFAGIRGAWIKVDWLMKFFAPIVIPSAEEQDYTYFKVDNTYKAGGLVGGFESKWNLYKGFGVFSFASASLLYGKSEENSKQEYFFIPAGESVTMEQTLKAWNSAYTVKGAFDISAGFKWERELYKKVHLMLYAGWEFFYWPSVTQKTIFQSTRTRDRADLSYEGLILGAKVEF